MMNKINVVLKYFINNPLISSAFFFSIIPFWVVFLWFAKSNANLTIFFTISMLIITGKCIVDSQMQNRNPFLLLIKLITGYTASLIGYVMLTIWLLVLFFVMILTNDLILQFISLGLMIMSMLFAIFFGNKNYLTTIWGNENIKGKQRFFWIGTAIIFSWLVFIYIDNAVYKYISIALIIFLEILKFVRKHESLI